MADILKIDLIEDFRTLIINNLSKSGYNVSQETDVKQLLIQYLNLINRIVPQCIRQVKYSKKMLTLFLSDDERKAVEMIANKATRGEDLNPHLSTTLKDIEFNDQLLNDWGIYHFHLGTTPYNKDPRFMDRTGKLLFAIVADDTIYFLDVLDHKSFSSQPLFNIMCEDFSQLVEPYKLHGCSFSPNFEDGDRDELRKAGLHMVSKGPDGSWYSPPGGGITSSGDNSKIVCEANKKLEEIKACERYCKENTSSIIARIEKYTNQKITSLKLLLSDINGVLCIVEEGSGLLIFPEEE